MGSPVSPIVANSYMESFEHRAITSAMNPPRLLKKYVDHTFVILQQSQKEEFLQHLNSVDPSINCTTEETRPDGSVPFVDTLITPQKDGTLTTSVYRKATHTYFLQLDSHHNLACKYSVINTLTHRAKAVCSNSKLLEGELKHLQEVLTKCKYPKWAIDKVLQKQEDRRIDNRRNQGKNNTNQTGKKCHLLVPYSQGLCESYKTICCKYGVQVHFKGGDTLKNLLIFPKDKEATPKLSITKQSNIIYQFKCGTD